jgi:hypothetical protein
LELEGRPRVKACVDAGATSAQFWRSSTNNWTKKVRRCA